MWVQRKTQPTSANTAGSALGEWINTERVSIVSADFHETTSDTWHIQLDNAFLYTDEAVFTTQSDAEAYLSKLFPLTVATTAIAP